ncbi:MAG: cyclic nucleotide-binding domain-containing protein [Bdellovibrionales bacterium]|nr:cyclic nucleotide-binding domain-containing protein [Bdellovibrionales bacterium]
MAAHPHYLWRDLFRRRKSNEDTIIEALGENILFCTLSARELRYLTSLVYERVYQVDEPIFREGERGSGMYVIVAGRVAIKTHHPNSEVLVTTLGKGSFFGELSLVEPENVRTATAVATERTVVVGFFKPDLMEVLERKPQMGVRILFQLASVLGRRLLETTRKITEMKEERRVGQLRENSAG